MIIVALVIIGVIVSAIYTYLFQQVYTERYGRRGLSYVLAAILATGIMWFSLEYEVPSGWEYKVSLASNNYSIGSVKSDLDNKRIA